MDNQKHKFKWHIYYIFFKVPPILLVYTNSIKRGFIGTTKVDIYRIIKNKDRLWDMWQNDVKVGHFH